MYMTHVEQALELLVWIIDVERLGYPFSVRMHQPMSLNVPGPA
jgi:hypothetical protein